MNCFLKRTEAVCACLIIGLSHSLGAAEPNTLSASEKAAGWKLLFDGQTTEGWRTYRTKAFPERGWVVRDGWLIKQGNVRGGDIMTVDQYSDFELEWEWKISERGNNGVKYFILEERKATIGHEYQMMDDRGRNGKGTTASFYNVLAPSENKPMKAAGEVNHSRVIVRGNQVEHWLNGAKVLEYECGSPEVLAAVAQSKFKEVEGFGRKVRGHILLTDHGSECWFRNIKLRPLDPGAGS